MVTNVTLKRNVGPEFEMTAFINHLAASGSEPGAEAVKMAEITEMEVTKTTLTTTEIIMETDMPSITTKINKGKTITGHVDS